MVLRYLGLSKRLAFCLDCMVLLAFSELSAKGGWRMFQNTYKHKFILSAVLTCMLLPASVSADAYDAGLERDCCELVCFLSGKAPKRS